VYAGRPVIVRPDRYHVGYWRVPEHLSGQGGHDVVVYALEGDRVHIDDRNISPLVVGRAALDAARARVGSYKNSLYVIYPDRELIPLDTLRAAVRAGLEDAVSYLGSSSDSFSLPAWRKWSRLMTDTRNPKAWPRVFADRQGLAGALLSVWEGASPMGMTGGHLRDLYAEFLVEASDLLGMPDLERVADDFRAASKAWEAVAAAALPDAVPELTRVSQLTADVRAEVADPAAAETGEGDRAAAELWETRRRLDTDFPLDESGVQRVFEQLGAAVADVYARETAAVEHLARVL
jgi:hypothetical protein